MSGSGCCALFCAIIAVWGMVMLTILGMLYGGKYLTPESIGGDVTDEMLQKTSFGCYVAAILYLFVLVLAVWYRSLDNYLERTGGYSHIERQLLSADNLDRYDDERYTRRHSRVHLESSPFRSIYAWRAAVAVFIFSTMMTYYRMYFSDNDENDIVQPQ